MVGWPRNDWPSHPWRNQQEVLANVSGTQLALSTWAGGGAHGAAGSTALETTVSIRLPRMLPWKTRRGVETPEHTWKQRLTTEQLWASAAEEHADICRKRWIFLAAKCWRPKWTNKTKKVYFIKLTLKPRRKQFLVPQVWRHAKEEELHLFMKTCHPGGGAKTFKGGKRGGSGVGDPCKIKDLKYVFFLIFYGCLLAFSVNFTLFLFSLFYCFNWFYCCYCFVIVFYLVILFTFDLCSALWLPLFYESSTNNTLIDWLILI